MIKVYSTPTCPYCVQVKKYLEEKEVEFEDIDVSSDREAAKEMIKETGQRGVPVTEIDGQFIIGFNKAKIDELLEG